MADKSKEGQRQSGGGQAGGERKSGTKDAPYPGMMGDGTEEQNLNQPGNPDARITQDEVEDAFGKGGGSASNKVGGKT